MNELLYRNKEWLLQQFIKYDYKPSIIARETNYPRTCITRYAKKFGIYNRKFERSPKNNIDENYFSIIDSNDKAYFLGLIMADGNIYSYPNSDKLQFALKLKSDDEEILYKFCNYIKFDINKITKRIALRNKTKTYSSQIRSYNKVFCNNLMKYGIVPNKTGKEKFIDCGIYTKDFIRGFLDGDGWISINNHNIGWCSTNLEILLDIKKYFKKYNISLNLKKSRTVYTISKYKKEDVVKIINHLYYDNCICFDRKRKNAETIINNIENQYKISSL